GDRARRRAIGFQHAEARTVDRLERQKRLEARLGRRIELAGCADCAIAIEIGPVTLEAQCRLAAALAFPVRCAREVRPAGLTEGPRAAPLELSARKRNPLVVNDLRGVGAHTRGV